MVVHIFERCTESHFAVGKWYNAKAQKEATACLFRFSLEMTGDETEAGERRDSRDHVAMTLSSYDRISNNNKNKVSWLFLRATEDIQG